MSTTASDRYKAAGVDIDAGDDLVRRIGPLAAATRVAGATAGLGGFGGIFDLAAAGFGEGSPRLVAGTDGVGTKLKVAFATDRHDTIGIDCVAMCVNDVLAVGARPLFFLDYFATGRLRPDTAGAVVAGIAEGCKQAGCWLMGGETAEMPGMYADGEYDLAGFVVGAVRPDQELRPDACAAGDIVLGVASAGLHSNGYSLARKVLLDDAALPLDRPLDGDDITLGERLLVPTRIYVKAFEALCSASDVHALAHITGGGLWENPQRSIPDDLAVRFDIDALRAMRLPVFDAISSIGAVSEREMYRVFNMGVGMTVAMPAADEAAAIAALAECGIMAARVGRLDTRGDDGERVFIAGISDAPTGS